MVERQAAFEMGDQMRDAVGAHRRQGGVEPARGERRDFVERALAQHFVEARLDARVERRALGGEERPAQAPAGRAGAWRAP